MSCIARWPLVRTDSFSRKIMSARWLRAVWPVGSVASGRADWGLGIEAVADAYDLGFYPLRDEEYDFLTLRDRLEREPVKAFLEVLRSMGFRQALEALPGFAADPRTGEWE